MSEQLFWNLFEDAYINDSKWKIFANMFESIMNKCDYTFGICINNDGSVSN